MSQGENRNGTGSDTEESGGKGQGVPPWQRVTSKVRGDSSTGDSALAGSSGQLSGDLTEELADDDYDDELDELTDIDEAPTMIQRPVKPDNDAHETLFAPGGGNEGVAASGSGAAAGGRTAVNVDRASKQNRPKGTPSALRRPGRGPRRASLQLKRVDPWSVLKLAFVLSVAFFLVMLVAVGVLYAVLGGMGVWDKINGTYSDFVSSGAANPQPLITIGSVFAVTAVVGLVNIILFTALATVGAFVYNVCADLAGGLEVTLAERE